MSYILDALRKAEAERERGTVPGIHAQPVRQVSAEAAARAAMPTWVWAVVAACVVLAGLLVWQMVRRGSDAVAPVVTAAAPSASAVTVTPTATVLATPATATTPTPTPTPMTASPAAPPAVTATPPAKSPPLPAIAAALREAVPAVRKPAPTASAAGTSPTPAAAPPVVLAAAQPAAMPQPVSPGAVQKPSPPVASNANSAQPTEPRIYALNELPDDIRRQLPNLSVSGSMYSAVPANRLVIFNGQVFHEGDKVTTDLVLEQISPKAAVLRYKTYRYQLTY